MSTTDQEYIITRMCNPKDKEIVRLMTNKIKLMRIANAIRAIEKMKKMQGCVRILKYDDVQGVPIAKVESG